MTSEYNDDIKLHEVESTVIGSIFLEPDLIHETVLTPDHFRGKESRLIFQAFMHLKDKGTPVDLVTVIDLLVSKDKLEEAGGFQFISGVASSVPTTANFAFYQKSVLNAHKQRSMIQAAHEFISNPSEEEAEKLTKNLIDLQEGNAEESQTNQEVLLELQNEMFEDTGGVKGIDSGFPQFNAMTGGVQGGQLVIIAARPSMGKTAIVLEMSKNNCLKHGVTDVFSLEMGKKDLTKRLLSNLGNIEGLKWQNPFRFFSEKDHSNATQAIGIFSGMRLNIHDEPRQTVSQIRAQVRKTKRENPNVPHLVVIDYLQLITTTERFSREDLRIASITRELKLMARQFDVPIILLSQLSRSVEQRQDKRPMMSDLRESGAIEQDWTYMCK